MTMAVVMIFGYCYITEDDDGTIGPDWHFVDKPPKKSDVCFGTLVEGSLENLPDTLSLEIVRLERIQPTETEDQEI